MTNKEDHQPESRGMRIVLRADRFSSSHWGIMILTLLIFVMAITVSIPGIIAAIAILLSWSSVAFFAKRYEQGHR
ncbi:hypothetical protein QNO07_10820 [Streptomyces sp. 549]|uniref:hypothetical protein n=1 Tax=Streptomyces sp. 549 TaxID=3049076 RepID=UPI0024C29957|nr:hypothetical protein [Streptomyces sp. 549]MDK1473902.1 hypothetical protein [Streptomyces sp. 549]